MNTFSSDYDIVFGLRVFFEHRLAAVNAAADGTLGFAEVQGEVAQAVGFVRERFATRGALKAVANQHALRPQERIAGLKVGADVLGLNVIV